MEIKDELCRACNTNCTNDKSISDFGCKISREETTLETMSGYRWEDNINMNFTVMQSGDK
jgi:hypothetical protein